MMNYNSFPAMVVCSLAVALMVACAPEPTPASTINVEPSETAAVPTTTSIPEPTDTPIPPTDTPAPTRTPRPTFTPKPSRTPTPTLTPTNTPRPSMGIGPFRAVVPVDGVIPGEDPRLRTSPDGTLWLYSDQAIARLQDDETWSIFLPEYEGAFAGFDAQGRLWTASYELTWISALDGQNWTRYGEESGWVPPGPGLYTSYPVQSGLYTDSLGRLWLATAEDVRAFDGQQWFIFGPEEMGMDPPEVEGTSVYGFEIYEDVIWVSECQIFGPGPGPGQGVRWFDGEWHGSDSPLATGCVTTLTSHDGQIWIGMGDRLWQADPHGEEWTSISMPEEALGKWNFGYPISLNFGPSGDDLWATYVMCGGASCGEFLNFYHIEGGVWTLIAEIGYYPFPSARLLTLGADGTPWFFSYEGIDRVLDNRREPVSDLIALSVTWDSTGQIWFIAEQDGQNWLWTLDDSE